jgi:Ni/Co efflux regulator RcnB
VSRVWRGRFRHPPWGGGRRSGEAFRFGSLLVVVLVVAALDPTDLDALANVLVVLANFAASAACCFLQSAEAATASRHADQMAPRDGLTERAWRPHRDHTSTAPHHSHDRHSHGFKRQPQPAGGGGLHQQVQLRSLRLPRDEGLLEFRRGRGIAVAGTPERGAVIQRAKELVDFARHHGYRVDELVEIIKDVG